MQILDLKAALGMVATATSGWVDWAEPVVTMTVTILVGGATLWYTVERALQLRKARKDNESI